MESSTTIIGMLAANSIFVPSYQRAYSWDTDPNKQDSHKQVNQFLADLGQHNDSSARSPYYFGHFLFEQRSATEYGVVDGQQRLTTIIIFLCALFRRLDEIRERTDEEKQAYEDLIKRYSTYRFTTVDADKQLLIDYVVNRTKKDHVGLRIVAAYDYFAAVLADKTDIYITKMLSTIKQARCTTHPVTDETEAIQMFIFQNNRGKKPSNLEILKAQFLFHIHLYGAGETAAIIDEIKDRFRRIYESIATIEDRVDEDEVLQYSLRVHFNSLTESTPLERIGKELDGPKGIAFVQTFCQTLQSSFEYLTTFFGDDEKQYFPIHSLVTLGNIGIALPFNIKAYRFGLPKDYLCTLCGSLESVVLRKRVIGTRADLASRLRDVFELFTADKPSITRIVDRIRWMKTTGAAEWWYAYWNNHELRHALQIVNNPATAKFLLWKYENMPRPGDKNGYEPSRYETIKDPELEHIAPQTENKNNGYEEYDEEFRSQYLDCLGNYLLISKSHNCSDKNDAFAIKRGNYIHLRQQREVQEMTADAVVWTKHLIKRRQQKIIDTLMDSL
jgi:hypothetical protein